MKTAEEIYRSMLAVYEEKTGFAMHDASDLAVRLYAAAAELESLYAYSDWALTQSFPQTASGEYLDYHGTLRGLSRRRAPARAASSGLCWTWRARRTSLSRPGPSAPRRDWCGL